MNHGTNGKQHFNASLPNIAIEWPRPISDIGMYGIAGEFVRLVEAHTEGDRNAILLSFLAFAGNLIGRDYYVPTGSDRQHGNLYLCIVGSTATGRKGSAISAAESFFNHGEHPPKLPKVIYGVSSGEGVIHKVRDKKIKRELNKKTQQQEEVLTDEGIADKRVTFCLSEFQQYIASMRRQDSILSAVIRQAWDKGNIASPSKNDEIAATNPHISIIASISKEELLTETNHVDAHNGTLNRFLFACAQRSRLLPEGGDFETLYQTREWTELQRQFNENIRNATTFAMRIRRESDTQDDWGRDQSPDRGLYKVLSEQRIGLWGAITARAAQQLIRMSLISAIINGHRSIQSSDQDAAHEYWRYCDDSGKYIFGNQIQDPHAIRILITLRETPNGMNRRELHALLHFSAEILEQCLTWLSEVGLIYHHDEQTGGRPAQRWFASL